MDIVSPSQGEAGGRPEAASVLAGRWPALAALALGVVFLFGTGFSHIDAVHNAAHDARHSAGFPCH